MRFVVQINTAEGERRSAEFESRYDATTVLVEQVKRDILKPGESIVMGEPPRDRQDRNRKESIPRIERIA